MASYVPTFKLTNVIKLAIGFGSFKGVNTGQWVRLKDGTTGRLVIKRKWKHMALPKMVSVVKHNSKEDFKSNIERFSRAVSYTRVR